MKNKPKRQKFKASGTRRTQKAMKTTKSIKTMDKEKYIFLAIDLGNTNIGFGVFQGGKLQGHYRTSSQRHLTSDEIAIFLDYIISKSQNLNSSITMAMAASVVPNLEVPLRLAVHKTLGITLEFLRTTDPYDVRIHYKPRENLGADRLANALAVKKKYKKASIVIDFGTATTFDVISELGDYEGGLIFPGVLSSLESLSLRAAKLPLVELKKPKNLIGQTTDESLQSGAVNGTEALITETVRLIKKEKNKKHRGSYKPLIILTGGISPFFARYIKFKKVLDPDLTLDGIYAAKEYRLAQQKQAINK